MKNIRIIFIASLALMIILSGCASMSKALKGGAIGAAAGGAAGAIIGRAAGNTAAGAVVGATVGGVTGSVIGAKMDKQAEEMKEQLPDEVIVERVGEGIVVEFTNNILFGFDSSDLKAEAKENLDKLTEILNKYPDTDIMIAGHTDNTGSDTYNQGLSERRAGAVSGYLAQKSIAAARLKTVGYGESDPRYTNDTEEGRASNRRVEFVITANEKMIEESKK
ncbi:MAG: OmpA family protein [Bacteroidales bacterium]|jgi:outer membrane protein OmpA-like peptidoglycan-associated protein|nr:OmpA family protein [Bacteroidales bacterium]